MGGGIAVNFERQATSKKRLKVRWDHPVPSTEEPLDLQSALKEIRGDDPRPMIILRDCDRCNGKDDALLSKTLDNERTLLYTQFFHCIKLDRRVTESSHPWHAIFADAKPPHLYLASFDGSELESLAGDQTQKQLWGTMSGILSKDYQRDAMTAVKSWQRVLDRFDAIDSREMELKRQIADMEVKEKDRRVAALQKQLDKLVKEREAAFADESKVMELVLRHAPKAKTVADFDAEAAARVEGGSGSGLLDRIKKKDGNKPGGN